MDPKTCPDPRRQRQRHAQVLDNDNDDNDGNDDNDNDGNDNDGNDNDGEGSEHVGGDGDNDYDGPMAHPLSISACRIRLPHPFTEFAYRTRLSHPFTLSVYRTVEQIKVNVMNTIIHGHGMEIYFEKR